MSKASDEDLLQLWWDKDISDLPATQALEFATVFVEYVEKTVKALKLRDLSVSLLALQRSSTKALACVRGPNPVNARRELKIVAGELRKNETFRAAVAKTTGGKGKVRFGIGRSSAELEVLPPPAAEAERDEDARPGFDTVIGELTRLGGDRSITAQLRIDLPKSALVEVVLDNREDAKRWSSMLYTLIEVTGMCVYDGLTPCKITEIIEVRPVPKRTREDLLRDVNEWVDSLTLLEAE